MKIFTTLALTLVALAAIASAAPAPIAPGGDLLKSLALPLQNLGGNPQNTPQPVQDAARASHPGAKEYVINKKRSVNPRVDTVIDAIVKVNTKVKVLATGLLATEASVIIPEISARVETETNAAVNTKVDTDAKVLVLDNMHDHARRVISKHCPHSGDKCIRHRAKDIVADVEALVKADIEHLFIALKLNLMTHVRAHVAVVIRDLRVNLFLEQIHIQSSVDAADELDLHLDTCSHIIVKGLHVTVMADAVAAIRGICSA
ncbi:hypothetical protein BGX26_003471 [Mortierella sp. AD094]|nr:hypothetical protein BGX26_003471 [Mortierella sp. AD094]